ncbi:MAG: hypothetical protein FWG71_03575 [Synergistaceae bacterium]|nr:hypothetical protein [Synergistaceae bacterium]
MRKEFKYITAISMIFVLIMITAGGFRLPWNEEAALYAVYGGAVGFYAAIVMSMFIVWRINKKQKPNGK